VPTRKTRQLPDQPECGPEGLRPGTGAGPWRRRKRVEQRANSRGPPQCLHPRRTAATLPAPRDPSRGLPQHLQATAESNRWPPPARKRSSSAAMGLAFEAAVAQCLCLLPGISTASGGRAPRRGRKPAQPHARFGFERSKSEKLLIDGKPDHGDLQLPRRVSARSVTRQIEGSLSGGRVSSTGHHPQHRGIPGFSRSSSGGLFIRTGEAPGAEPFDFRMPHDQGRSRPQQKGQGADFDLGKHRPPLSDVSATAAAAPRKTGPGARFGEARWLQGSPPPGLPAPPGTSRRGGSPEGWPSPGGSPCSRAEPALGSSCFRPGAGTPPD